MSERSDWSRFDMNKNAVGLGPEITFKYGIPYPWGALHVTNQAEDSYGFVPLTADVVNGDGIDTSSRLGAGIRTDVYLMSPEEFIEQVAEGTLSPNFMINNLGFGSTALHKDGIELRLALRQDTNDFSNFLISEISELSERFGSNITDFTNEDNIPVTEVIGQGSPQMLMHLLCALTSEAIKESSAELFTINSNKRALKKMTALGSLGLVGAGALLGVSSIAGEVNIYNASIAMAYASYYGSAAQRSMRQHLKQATAERSRIESIADRYADVVTETIHQTYCTAHFDSQAENNFGDS